MNGEWTGKIPDREPRVEGKRMPWLEAQPGLKFPFMNSTGTPVPTSIVSVDLVAAALRSEDFAGIPKHDLTTDARDYERFLLLARARPSEPLAPTKAIDRMWHLHMLHPRAYAGDCQRLFGEILDHDGGFGATADEAPVLAETFASTANLWEATFGVPYTGSAVKCTHNCVSRCRRACKSKVRAKIQEA